MRPAVQRYYVLFVFAAGTLLFLPWYLAFYPGVLTPDSVWQMQQALGIKPLQSQHPVFHTLLIRLFFYPGFFAAGGSWEMLTEIRSGMVTEAGGRAATAGAASYILAQLLYCSGVYAYVLSVFRKTGIPLVFRTLTFFFFYLIPFNSIYSVTMWKDVPFSATVLLLCASMLDWSQKRENGKWEFSGRQKIVLGLLCTAVCLLRTNGVFGILAFFLIFAVTDRAGFRKVLLPALVSLAAFFLFQGPVCGAMGVEKASISEALSVPYQQIAAVITQDSLDEEGRLENAEGEYVLPASVTGATYEDVVTGKNGLVKEEEYAFLNRVVDTSKIPTAYMPELADSMKALVNAKGNTSLFRKEFPEFAALYLKLGLRNPGIYFTSYIDEVRGFLLPTIGRSWSYCSEVEANDMGIARNNLLSYGTMIFLYNILNVFTRVCRWVFCPAFALYAILLMLLLCKAADRRAGNAEERHRRRPGFGPVFALPLGIWLSVMLSTPVSCDLRYVYSLFISFPVFAAEFYLISREAHAGEKSVE